MAEELHIDHSLSKEETYKALLPQVEGLLSYEADMVANQANLCAVLKEAFNWLWIGFYRVEGEELILGPFQGPIACTRITIGKGVCGTVAANKETLIVPNVDEFPGHIACSSLSKSEIVLPVFQEDQLIAVLDIDSSELDQFDAVDAKYLAEMLQYL